MINMALVVRDSKKTSWLAPKNRKVIEVTNRAHELVKDLTFPWCVSEIFSKYPYAKVAQVMISYTPYIWITDHGTVSLVIKDCRKSFLKEQNLVAFKFPTNQSLQFEVLDLESCRRDRENPISISVSLDSKGLAEGASVGRIVISVFYKYSKDMFPRSNPRINPGISLPEDLVLEKSYSQDDCTVLVKVGPSLQA